MVLKYFKDTYHFEYRCGPVPRTGRWRRVRWLRSVRTTQERRENIAYLNECGIIRGARRPSRVPDDWEDRVRSDFKDKSWKRKKKTKQWM